MLGKLFGLGLGPGDPELVTVKAVRILKSVSAVAFPILEGKESFARSIADQYIPKEINQIPIVVPMTQDRLPAQKAYDKAAQQISKSFGPWTGCSLPLRRRSIFLWIVYVHFCSIIKNV